MIPCKGGARTCGSRCLGRMGLLPAEGLIEAPAGAELPPKQVPVSPPSTIVAVDQIVGGVRIGAAGAADEEVLLEAAGFEFVPTALRLGFPLMFKKLEFPPGGEELGADERIYVYSLMMTPGLGLPITWNANGAATRLPPLLAARSDGVAFGAAEWACLRGFFHDHLPDNYVKPQRHWHHTPDEFRRWVRVVAQGRCLSKEEEAPEVFADLEPCLDLRFPLGARVTIAGLSRAELNGRCGTVARYDDAKGRVGVELPPPHGLLSIRPASLRVEPHHRSALLLEKCSSR